MSAPAQNVSSSPAAADAQRERTASADPGGQPGDGQAASPTAPARPWPAPEPGTPPAALPGRDEAEPAARTEAADHIARRRPPVSSPARRPVALTILAVLAVAYTIYFGRSLFFPIVLACILSFLFRPVVRSMQRRGVPALFGAALVVLSLLFTAGTGVYLLAAPATTWVEEMPENLRQVENRFWFVFQRIRNIERASKEVQQIARPPGGGSGSEGSPTPEEDEPAVQVVEFRQPSLVQTALSTTGEVSAGVIIVAVLLFLLLALSDVFLNKVLGLLPTFRDKRDAVELVRDVEQGISRYLGTITFINVCLGIVIGTVLGLLGMPNPLLWGVMAAVLNFIPYLGAAAGVAIVGMAALLTFDSVAYALLAPLCYLVITGLEGNVVTPLVLGRSMSLNPLIVFLSLVVWGWMWGVAGVLIAVPLLGIVKIVCEHFRSLRPISSLIAR